MGSNGNKRRQSESSDGASSSSEDETGPALPSSVPPKKKRRVLPHESLYLAALPLGLRYAKSLMHKDQLAFTTFTPHTDFLVTAGADGQVSFWKKSSKAGDLDFVKEFRAHNPNAIAEQGSSIPGPVLRGVSTSWDGRLFATCGADRTVKVWDVVTFDLVAVLNLKKTPTCVAWVYGRGAASQLLAVGNEEDGQICVYDGRGEVQEPLFLAGKGRLHRRPVVSMAYNIQWDCVISADDAGMMEYWRPTEEGQKPTKLEGLWEVKSTTGLFEFKKAKSTPCSITISPSGHQFACLSLPDRQVRVFDFASGKLHRTYDESLETITSMQQAGTALVSLDAVELGRRLAIEKEIDHPALRSRQNVVFDETGHFILYGSMLGVKVVNTLTNRVMRLYGKDESFRSLHLALYQGQPEKKGVVTVEMAASENPLLQEAEARDALLVCTGSGKVRFYMFTNATEVDKTSRDVQNEKPQHVGRAAKDQAKSKGQSGTSAVVHTTLGDVHLRLFPDIAPKAVENFVTHSRRGYYNNVIFHRVIRKFMIQTGDPFGDGTGGESIWGGEFEDEFSNLKHDKPYTLSMANAGPNTNGSQFFITTEKAPWLDGKHTIFGRAVKGMDIVHRIENVKTHKEKPLDDIRIVNIDIS